jgi:hypothetical protein
MTITRLAAAIALASVTLTSITAQAQTIQNRSGAGLSPHGASPYTANRLATTRPGETHQVCWDDGAFCVTDEEFHQLMANCINAGRDCEAAATADPE